MNLDYPYSQQLTVIAYEAASLTALQAAIQVDLVTRGGKVLSVDFECQNQYSTVATSFIDASAGLAMAQLQSFMTANPTFNITCLSTVELAGQVSVCVTFSVAASSGQYLALITYINK